MSRTPLADRPLFIVMADFGRDGREAIVNPEQTREQVVQDLVDGQVDRPLFVLESNPVENRCRDISADIAEEVVALARKNGDTLINGVFDFCAGNSATPAWASGMVRGGFFGLDDEEAA